MATVAEHLVGRAAELGEVDAALGRLASGGASPILIAGEPGIGKSRLLAELEALADRRGFVVLSGSASELEADLPFWIFVDALEEYVAGLDSRRLASLDPDVRAELALVFPALSGLSDGNLAARFDERYRSHRAVRELLECIAATKPLVLLIDDLHWADPASVDLLAALLRRPPTASVLLVMAARPNQMPERLVAAAGRAARHGALLRLDLRPLQREEAGELLGAREDAALIDTLYDLSGGNPFYLEQLARSSEQGSPRAHAAGRATMAGLNVPPIVADSVIEELRRLNPDARRILEGASIAGDPFEPELAAAAAGLDQAVATTGLDDLLDSGLIRHTDVPRRFRFRHPLTRRAVYEAAAGAWVLEAHGRCADALAARGASPALRAHHVEYAARHGDEAAISLLVDAAGDAAPRAPATAARWFGAALRLLPDTAPAGQRMALLNARAGLLAATGQLAAARELLLESVGLVSEEDVGNRIQLTAACAGIEHLLGRHAEARARLAAALARLPDGASREAVALKLELASESVFDSDYTAMRERAADALDGARPLGDPALTATAAALVAMAAACLGDIPAAIVHHDEATALVDAMPDAQLATGLQAIGFLAHCELYLDRYGAALAHAERGVELARATGQVSPTLVPALLTALTMCGRFAEADELVDSALESARMSQIPQAIAWALVNCAFAALSAGATDRARTYARESLDHSEGNEDAFAEAWAGLSLAAALAATGDTARAEEVLLAKAGGEELTAFPANWRVFGLQILVRCRLAQGRHADARRSLKRAHETAAALALPMAAAWADRAAAEVALADDAPAIAADRALASAASARRAGAAVEAALSQTLAGQALALAGRANEALAELEEAAATLDAAGAPRLRDAAERELRKLGRTVHRRTRRGTPSATGLESLTERERQVAALVVDRKTNPQIAAELFLSLKTVETHLRNIFRKLDVSSRIELARSVERAEHPA